MSRVRCCQIAIALLIASGVLWIGPPASGAATTDDESRLLSLFLQLDAKPERLLDDAANVLARIQGGKNPSLQAIAYSMQCRAHILQSGIARSERACMTALQLSKRGSDRAVFAAERMSGILLLERGAPVMAVPALLASYEAAVRIDDELATAVALFTLGSAAQFAGANADAIDYYDRAQDFATRIGEHRLRSRIANNLGVLLLESGDPEAARVQYLNAIDAARSVPDGGFGVPAAYDLVLVEMELGRAPDAASRIRALINEHHQQETPALRAEAQLKLARAEFRAGDQGAAAAAARSAAAMLIESHPIRAFPAQALLVQILIAEGKLDAAERLTAQLLLRIPEDARGRLDLLDAREKLLAASGRHREAYLVAVETRRLRARQSTTRLSQTLAFMRARTDTGASTRSGRAARGRTARGK